MRFIREKNKIAGFTLVEMLVVTTILSIVALAIFQTFANGLSLYRRLSGEIPGMEMEFFFERMNQELRNAFEYNGKKLTASDSELEFVTFIYSSIKKARLPGQVRYVWDSSSSKLIRYDNDFFGVSQGSDLRRHYELNDVKLANFSFLGYDEQKKQYIWKDSWDQENFPIAVRINLNYGTNDGIITRVIEIPRLIDDSRDEM